ncbi:hypothetical protein DPEC_G00186520 [Dallia pectoralis]|uniref:Uncharacterized protein n=1 Tax=Dallia pectoralis TaxID=75939 RepID=A0ACC2GBY9_DALPE|nr:hypothetical protein DPEC_G00186520 [Dallia pectoralis]
MKRPGYPTPGAVRGEPAYVDREDTTDRTNAWGGDRQSSTHCSLDKTESRLKSRTVMVPNRAPNALTNPLSSKTSRLGEYLVTADTAQRASAEPRTRSPAEETSSAELEAEGKSLCHIVCQTESLHTVKTACPRLDGDLESTATVVSPPGSGTPPRFNVVIVAQDNGSCNTFSQSTSEDLLKDVEYVNAFLEHTPGDSYSSDLDVDKQILNVESYHDPFFDPLSIL